MRTTMDDAADGWHRVKKLNRVASAVACLAWLVCGGWTVWSYAHGEAVDGLTLFGNLSALVIALYWSAHRAATGQYPR